MRWNSPTFLFLVVKKSLVVRSVGRFADGVYPMATLLPATVLPKPPTEKPKPPIGFPVAGFGFSIGGFGGGVVSARGMAAGLNLVEGFDKQTLQPVSSWISARRETELKG